MKLFFCFVMFYIFFSSLFYFSDIDNKCLHQMPYKSCEVIFPWRIVLLDCSLHCFQFWVAPQVFFMECYPWQSCKYRTSKVFGLCWYFHYMTIFCSFFLLIYPNKIKRNSCIFLSFDKIWLKYKIFIKCMLKLCV